MNDTNRHPGLLYAFDEKPSFVAMLLFASQYLIPNMISLLFLILVLQQVHIPPLLSASLISITMIIMAIVNILQALKTKYIGSGMLLPPSIAPPFIPASIIAVKTGGLSLLFGMTFMAGIIQTALSFVVKHVKNFIPKEIAALILMQIGFELASFGIRTYASLAVPKMPLSNSLLYYGTMALPLMLILIFDQLCTRAIQKYSIILAAIISYLAIFFLGYMNPKHIALISQSPWVFLPHVFFGKLHFSFDLSVPFIFAAIICVVKMIGSVSALEEIQVTHWKGPDFTRLAKANFIDGLGTLLAGLFGSVGMNASSSGIALSLSKGVTSRFIAIPLAFMTFLLAFSPKVGFILLYIPKAIMAAVLLDMGSALVKSSCLILLKSIKQFQVELYVGIGLAVGLSYCVYPEIYQKLPPYLHLFLGSSIAVSMICAVGLHLIFKLFKKQAPV